MSKIVTRCLSFMRQEAVLSIAALLAVVSAFFVPDCFSIKTLKRRRADTQVRPYKRENFPISFN